MNSNSYQNSSALIRNATNVSNDIIQKIISSELNNIELMKNKLDKNNLNNINNNINNNTNNNYINNNNNNLNSLARSVSVKNYDRSMDKEKAKSYNENHMENKLFAKKEIP